MKTGTRKHPTEALGLKYILDGTHGYLLGKLERHQSSLISPSIGSFFCVTRFLLFLISISKQGLAIN